MKPVVDVVTPVTVATLGSPVAVDVQDQLCTRKKAVQVSKALTKATKRSKSSMPNSRKNQTHRRQNAHTTDNRGHRSLSLSSATISTTSLAISTTLFKILLKLFFFTFNSFCVISSLTLISSGIWAWIKKETKLSILTSNIFLDPALVIITIGLILFVISFCGIIASWKQNDRFLNLYSKLLTFFLLIEICVALSVILFKDTIRDYLRSGFQLLINQYREDADQQNLIDWIQQSWLQCCGSDGPKDWDDNIYFNCSIDKDSWNHQNCGVPFSCCKLFFETGESNISDCGTNIRNFESKIDVSKIINEKGCIQAIEEWLTRNLLSICLLVIGTLFTQLLVLCSAQSLRALCSN